MKFFKYILDSIELDVNPAGWDDLGISYIRNMTYHSVLRSFTTKSIRFANVTGGGYDQILAAYNSYGINADLSLQIKIYNGQTDLYDNYWNGKLDFTEISIERDFIEIKMIDASKLQKLKSREEIEYNINSTTSSDNVTVDTIPNLIETIDLLPVDIILNAESTGGFAGVPSITGGDADTYNNGGTIVINQIGDDLNIENSSVLSGETTVYTNNSGETVYMKYGIIEGNYYITDPTYGNGGGSPKDAAFTITLYWKLSSGAATNVYSYTQTVLAIPAGGSSEPGSVDIDFSATLPDLTVLNGETIEFYAIYTLTETVIGSDVTMTPGDNGLALTKFDFSIDFEDWPKSTCSATFIDNVFTRLIQLITSETDTSKLFRSELLGRMDSDFEAYEIDGEHSMYCLMSAKSIRRYSENRSPLNVSLKEVFKLCDSCFSVGLGYDKINDRFYVEKLSEFYKPVIMITLSDVKNLKKTTYQYYNTVSIGVQDSLEYEEANGANEFQTKYEYSNDLVIDNNLDLSHKTHTDSVGIEYARRKPLALYGNEDTKYDDYNYFVNVELSGSTYQTKQGVIDYDGFYGGETYYNYAISNRERMLRHNLLANLWKSSNNILFIKSQKNTNFEYTNISGDAVNELDNIQLSELNNRLFDYELHEFESTVTGAQLNEIDSDPHRLISYTFNGVAYTGFLDSLEISRYDKLATWKILVYSTTLITKNMIFESGQNAIFENDKNVIGEEQS